MSASANNPEFVYRLASVEEWDETKATGAAPRREIDRKDGYFHLSAYEQVLETADLHFQHAKILLALEIPLAPITAQVKFELAPKRGEYFPHFYGVLRREHIKRAIMLTNDGGEFSFGDEVQ